MQKHLLLLFILLSFINENIAKACECAFINFTEANNYADLIFKGVVVNKKDSISIGKVFYTFKATQIWKGKTTQSITIETNFGGPACGATFTLDSEYVIYSTELSTSRCTRNSLASQCADIARLNYKYINYYKQNIAIDSSDVLSKYEGDYFNELFKNRQDKNYQLNFINKKVIILDPRLITKNEFFEKYGIMSAPIGFEKFSEKEAEQSGGYAGIITLYRKMRFTKHAKKKIIQHLSKKSSLP